MKKTTYWKDVWRTFVASKGRMLSIALLMALGSLDRNFSYEENWGTLLQESNSTSLI